MSSIDSLAKDLYQIIHDKEEKGPKPYEPVAEVVKIDEDNSDIVWVKIPGGDSETPVEKTIDAEIGDRVRVRVSGGRAWILGNATSPPASSEATVRYIQNGMEYDASFAENFSNSIVQNSTIVNSAVENAIIQNSEMVESRIYNSDIENFTVINGVVQNLEATDATIQGHLEAHDAEFESLDTNYAHITNGVIDNATIGYADIDDLDAHYAHITNGVIDNATIGYADIDDLDAHYAEIDLANVNNAWIEYGAMKKAEVFDENVFDLSGVQATISKIDASRINVANLNADNLIVRRINGQPVVGGYTLISPSSPGYSSKNPRALGWYEFVNAQFVLSTDTTVDMTKAYYQEGNEVSLYDQTYIDGMKNNLQQQIDGAVETFTGSTVPTLTNYPYNTWYDTSVTPIHDERAKHVGDIYYVVNSAVSENGYCYRFTYDNTSHAYSWVLIKDSDVTKALSDISDLQTFESNTTSWMEETDEGLVTIRQNYTNLSGTVDKTVKESIQLWFTKANTTPPTKPNSTTYPNGVTDQSTAGNGWRVVVPAWNASYPNYFYCWQYKFVDGTFGWSNVVRDIAMGETQGTARDAKNTADNALPASTFETFESTTFTELVDEVDEQSTTMTNMTTRLGLNSDGTGANTDIVSKESALEQTVDGISTRVGKTETKLIGMYATSSTPANTRAKVATIVPTLPNDAVWDLTSGTMVTVKFVNANTYAATSTSPLTLNVNSKGAKPINTYNNGDLSEAEYKWAAGSTFTFVYNGTNWLMQDSTQSVRMNSNETKINQTATSIESLASNQTTYTKPDGTTGTNAIKSAITQTANSIESVVANNATYTAPDGTTKTNTIQSAIKQNADNILLRVEKSGVIAAINASVEEQGGSAVKISADKVNITGTAVFDAVNNDASASAAMLNSNIQIGGRNLVWDTEWHHVASTWYNWGSPTTREIVEINGKRWLHLKTSGTAYQGYRQHEGLRNGVGEIKEGDIITVSFVAYASASTTASIGIHWRDSADTIISQNWYSPTLTTSAKKYSYSSYTVPSGAVAFNIMVGDNSTTIKELWITDVKLEKGNKATDWTPAPEDELAISVPIYKRTNTNSAPAVPTSIVTETTDQTTTGNWTKMHMPRICSANVNYKYLWTCNQLISAGGYLLGHTDVVADNGTTVINGDEITTGTISADRLNIAGTITAINNNTTTTINGGKITTGSIGTDQLHANSITADKLRIGDYTNYITATEKDENSLNTGVNPTISNGWLYKSDGTSANIWLSPSHTNWTKAGETYRVTGIVKAPAAGSVSVVIYGRNEGNGAVGNVFCTKVIPADTEVSIDGVITISDTVANAPKANVAISFSTTPTWTANYQQGYCKNMRCERISDVQVGGTNILRRTDNITISGSYWPNYGWYKSGTGTVTTGVSISDSPIPTITKAVQLTATNANTDIGFAQGGVPLRKGLVTQSVWAKGTAGDKITLQPVWANGDSAVTETGRMTFTIADSEWHRYTYTKEVQYNHPATSATSSATNLAANAGYVYLNTATVGHTLLVVGNKLEYGDKATEWTSGEDDYITTIDEAGIRIHPANTLNNSVIINAEGMEIFKGGTTSEYSVAKYGDTARIGAEGNANISIDGTSISGYGEDGKEFFIFSNGSTTMDTSILHKIYEGSDFPSTAATALSFTLPSGVKSGSTILIEYYFQYPSHGLHTLGVTQGTASNPSDIVSIGGQARTLHASYDGNDNITNIYISPSYGGTISCRIKYTKTDLAPSFEIGGELYASGGYSYAEGYCSQAVGDFSHAEGNNSFAYYTGCHAEGQWTKAGRNTNGVLGGYSAHAEGYNTTASGNVSHAEGNYTTASGSYSHAEGGSCTASNNYSHAEGHYTTASGQYSHAEGYSQNSGGQVSASTNASGEASHAEGGNTKASGNYSHAEGYYTTASGAASHAEGNSSVASGVRSHAQNESTTAVARAQTVIGSYNVEDAITSTTHASNQNEYGHYALIVGNGTLNTHSNAMTVNWNGNVNASGQYENLYKITTVQKVISGGINANNYVAAANISMTAQSGYNAVGIVGHASNYFRIQPTTNYVINNTTLYAGFANWSATNVTSDVTVTFYILWLKATSG